MSAIIILPGRPTMDPQLMQAKNGNTTYTTLDIACTQRGQDGKNETIFYSCYFNAFLADRLIKAGVKKGTGLIIYGDLELRPYIHTKGQNQGKPNAGPNVTVKDWQFAPSTRSDESGTNSGPTGGTPQNGYGQPVVPQNAYSGQGNGTPANMAPNNYGQPAGLPGGNYHANGGSPQNGYSQPPQNGFNQQPNSYGNSMQSGYVQPSGNLPNPPQNNQGQQANSYVPPNGSDTIPANYSNDGFTQVPEQQAGKLPFAA